METTESMIRTINLPSRWDIFKLPVDDLPEGQFQVKGDDGSWLLTTKEETILWHKLSEQMREMEMLYLLDYRPKKRKKDGINSRQDDATASSVSVPIT